MTKNVVIICLLVLLVVSIGWQFVLAVRPSPPDKPEVHVFLPDGYCGEFVVFWGENTEPVDEQPAFLSYNIHPTHPNAVVINLPAPYERAGLRFIYKQDRASDGRNPVFKLDTVGGVSTAMGRQVLEDGSTKTWTLSDSSIAYNLFTIGTNRTCHVPTNFDRDTLSSVYFQLSGTEFRWVSP